MTASRSPEESAGPGVPPQLSARAGRAGLMVAESAAILKRFYFLQCELVRMQAGWVPGTELWEYKLLLPEFLWEDALIAQLLRQRILELRFPDRRIVPGADGPLLAQWCAFRHAPDGAAFCAASLPALKGLLREAYAGYLTATDALDDGPSLRILRQAIEDIDRQLGQWAEVSRTQPAPPGGSAASVWAENVRRSARCVPAHSFLAEAAPDLRFDWNAAGGREFVFARHASRDPRFLRRLFAWPDRLDHRRGPGQGLELQLRVAVHHLNEVWAAEMAAAVLHDFAAEAPPEFLEEAARWCYDEIRHCRMGYARLREWGFRPEEMPLDTFSYDASASADPLVRLGTIYYFETAYIHTKSERAKIFTRTGDRLSAHDMDFDWADELIHTSYGARWLAHFIATRRDSRSPEQIKSQAQELIHGLQASATAEDREATVTGYRALLRQAESLARSPPRPRDGPG